MIEALLLLWELHWSSWAPAQGNLGTPRLAFMELVHYKQQVATATLRRPTCQPHHWHDLAVTTEPSLVQHVTYYY